MLARAALLLTHLVVVLHQPADSANVGAVVRAMANFGVSDLRLVEPAADDRERLYAAAHRADVIIDGMTRYASLSAALHDCALVLGTTGRARAIQPAVLTPRQAAQLLRRTGPAGAAAPRHAVVFGPERTGLGNDELALCHGILTIPTNPAYASLNLGQAVLIVLYEIWLADQDAPAPPTEGAISTVHLSEQDACAGVEARQTLLAALGDVLWALHPNTDHGRVSHTLARLRALLLRAVPTETETAMLTHLSRHIARRLRQWPSTERVESKDND